MATEDRTDGDTDLDEVMGELRRELVRRVAASDREEHREIYDALENE
jgi:hypothetical protein